MPASVAERVPSDAEAQLDRRPLAQAIRLVAQLSLDFQRHLPSRIAMQAVVWELDWFPYLSRTVRPVLWKAATKPGSVPPEELEAAQVRLWSFLAVGGWMFDDSPPMTPYPREDCYDALLYVTRDEPEAIDALDPFCFDSERGVQRAWDMDALIAFRPRTLLANGYLDKLLVECVKTCLGKLRRSEVWLPTPDAMPSTAMYFYSMVMYEMWERITDILDYRPKEASILYQGLLLHALPDDPWPAWIAFRDVVRDLVLHMQCRAVREFMEDHP